MRHLSFLNQYEIQSNFINILQIVGVPYIYKERDGNKYQNDEVSSNVCQAILKQTYMMFRLFMGSFETIINDPECGSVMLLKLKLEHFYSRVSKVTFFQSNISST